jgi:transposase InsO family protein
MAKKKKGGPGGRELATAYKLLVVKERMRGTPEKDVAAVFGVSMAAVQKWTTAFRRHGPSALESKRTGRGGKPGLRPLRTSPVQEKVIALKREHEEWGTRRIRDVLARFEALGVSEQQVRRILHDEGLIETPAEKPAREHEPRRFERAAPNQLWQSDIFTFRLRRAERLYVCVFMDDHSRFVVGHSLAHHQKSALVMEAFERGVAAYGQPAEVLTDNGRQYTVWRGKTEFEEALTRMGIHHIRSRPQHPQTLGKAERFWKTLWDEFLGRTVFAHVVDAQRRLDHFISHYNFQRPHQALDGLVPADRYFRAAAHVRAEIERQVAANELRLALEQPPRKPFYVVGQLGDQRLSIAAGATGLEVHVGDKTETIPLQEATDGTRTARRFVEEPQESTDPALADREDRPGRGGEEPRAPGPRGVVGREAGDDGDRGGWDLARLLLPARDQGAQRDAPGAGAGLGRRFQPGRGGAASPDQGARGEDREGGGGAAASGAAALRPAEADELGAGEDAPWAPSEDDNLLDAGWAQKLALLDDDEVDDAAAAGAEADPETTDEPGFDADAGWRERGPLSWDRKLAGADAPSDNQDHGEGPTSDVHTRARAAERPGAAPALRGDRGGLGGEADGERRGTLAGAVAHLLPDRPAPRDHRDHRGDHAEARGAATEAGAGGSARGGERAAASGARLAQGPDGDDRTDDERRRWDRFGEDAAAAVAEQEDEARGPRTGLAATPGGDDDA